MAAAVGPLIGIRGGGANLGDADRPELESEQLPVILMLKTTRAKWYQPGGLDRMLVGRTAGLRW
jgi:hypothetical protein